VGGEQKCQQDRVALAVPWHSARGSARRARAALGLGSTRGAARSWRWCRGAAEAQHMVGEMVLTPAAGCSGGAEELPEEEEERRRSEGLNWKFQKPEGLHCKQKFPTDPEL
jgi:hypothetical protein